MKEKQAKWLIAEKSNEFYKEIIYAALLAWRYRDTKCYWSFTDDLVHSASK